MPYLRQVWSDNPADDTPLSSARLNYMEIGIEDAMAAAEAATIADGEVTTAKLADAAVTDVKLAAGAVGNTHIQNSSIATVQIQAGAIESTRIASNAIGTSHIADGQITTAKIASSAVTASQLAPDSVNTSELVDGSVTAAKLASGAALAEVDYEQDILTIDRSPGSSEATITSEIVSMAAGTMLVTADVDIQMPGGSAIWIGVLKVGLTSSTPELGAMALQTNSLLRTTVSRSWIVTTTGSTTFYLRHYLLNYQSGVTVYRDQTNIKILRLGP